MQLACIFLGLTLLFSSPAWALGNDDIFASARNAYKNRDDQALAQYLQQLQAHDYVLAPYADYWLMLLHLSDADNDSVRNFLTRYADLPFADRVRGEWLKALGKRQNWDTFFEELPNYQGSDVAVSCYSIDGRAQRGDAQAYAMGRPLWLVAGEQPANCNVLFEHMVKARALTEDDIWARIRLSLQDGKITVAKSALQYLPNIDSADLKLLDRAYENPQRMMEKKLISTQSHYGREINLYMLDRLARSQPDLALDYWKQLQPMFTAEDRSYLWGRFALHAARRHDPAALTWFDRAQSVAPDQPVMLDKEQQAWRARAAMRVKDWTALQSAIADMPVTQQQDAVWRYWQARALKEKKQIPAANAILVPLSREPSYYGLLAEEELGDVLSEPPSYYRPAEDEVSAVKNLPGIQRAMELQRLDLRWEARTEWLWATRGFDDKQKIAAAELAMRQEWYDLAIITAEKTTFTHDFSLRYPMPYRELMQNSAREQGLDEAWVYGLTRQESRFIVYAKSGVGASGLMQVMPATAKWIAKQLGMNGYHDGKIGQLDTNIQMGTYYMRHVLDQMDGQPLMATAAYNAGPSRAKRWADSQPLEGAIYAETIPFSETRNYVQKVMGNAYFYAHRLGVKIQTLKQRLGVVAGSGGVLATAEGE
ncbi:MAG: transglycosylase SLT domain-containing protein [Methylophilaceae bacterium]